MAELRQISIFSENRPGKIEKITRTLADEKINILAINITSAGNFGILKFIVDKPDRALEVLQEKGLAVSLNEVIAIEMEDRPGGLHDVACALSRHRINVENAHVFIPESRRSAYLIVEVPDAGKAREVLEREGMTLYGRKHPSG